MISIGNFCFSKKALENGLKPLKLCFEHYVFIHVMTYSVWFLEGSTSTPQKKNGPQFVASPLSPYDEQGAFEM